MQVFAREDPAPKKRPSSIFSQWPRRRCRFSWVIQRFKASCPTVLVAAPITPPQEWEGLTMSCWHHLHEYRRTCIELHSDWLTVAWEGWTLPPGPHHRPPDSLRVAWWGWRRWAAWNLQTIPDPGSRRRKVNEEKWWSIQTDRDVQTKTRTHHFGGDVGVRQVPVLTHDRQVTVDVDGQSVSSQDHDTAHSGRGS